MISPFCWSIAFSPPAKFRLSRYFGSTSVFHALITRQRQYAFEGPCASHHRYHQRQSNVTTLYMEAQIYPDDLTTVEL